MTFGREIPGPAALTFLPGHEESLGEGAPSAPQLAGFGRRVTARGIDVVLIGIALVLGYNVIVPACKAFWGVAPKSDPLLIGLILAYPLVLLTFPLLYYALFERSRWQATPGKRVAGTVVIDLAGDRVSFARGLTRYMARAISDLVWVGYLIQPFTSRRQTAHDFVAGTLVVGRGWVKKEPSGTPYPPQRQWRGYPVWKLALAATSLLLLASVTVLYAAVIAPARDRFFTELVADPIEQPALWRWREETGNQLKVTDEILTFSIYWAPSAISLGSSSPGVSIDVDTDSREFSSSIYPTGIVFSAGGNVLYLATPVISNGKLKITNVESIGPYVFEKSIVTGHNFREGIENGINGALAARGVRATSLELRDGYILLLVEPL
jgi:uncharacterized RDD family membrane protein YckC